VHMDSLGLTNPCLTVHLTQAASVISGVTAEGEAVSLDVPETTYTLLLGHETGKSGVYLQWEGMVYKASNFLLGFWKTLEPASFLLTSPINFLINDLIALSLETPTHTRSYTVQMVESITENNQIATDEYGQILYDALIYRAGDAEPMNAETFLSWYVSLAELAPSGKVDASYQPLGEPLAALTLQSQSVTRRLAFYPYDALHMALSLDGECLYYVERSFLTALNAAP